MIRTALSFFVLFGALAVAGRWLLDSARDVPTSASEAAPAVEPRLDEAKPLPPASAQAAGVHEDSAIQLVAFDEALDEVLDSLKPTGGVKARVADEETGNEDASSSSAALSA